MVALAEDTPDEIFVDFDAISVDNLLSDPQAAKARITLFQLTMVWVSAWEASPRSGFFRLRGVYSR